jgi:rhamnogalacturonan endolyase
MGPILLWTILLVMPHVAVAQQPLVFEGEDVSSPQDAWVKDALTEGKWNLWSTDKDADKKWSGGVVLQSPVVKEDYARPEDGCPALHVVLTDIPPGSYEVTIKYGRGLAASIDGDEWQRLSDVGGRLGRFDIEEGTLEFWIDDRFADASNPGSCYFDTVTLTPILTGVNGIVNGDFEAGDELAESGWVWWSREDVGSARIVPEGRDASRCVRIEHTGERDWALTNPGRLAVEPGQILTATAWLKCTDTDDLSLSIVAYGQGKVLAYSMGADGLWATWDWTEAKATGTVPPGCDEVQVRLTGRGATLAWVDDVALEVIGRAPPPRPKTKVAGWAKTRFEEKLGRGVVALSRDPTGNYIGWRLLQSDPADLAFNVYRAVGRGRPVKLNEEPLTQSTDFVDEQAPSDAPCTYWVRSVLGGKEGRPSEKVTVPPRAEALPYLRIKLDGEYTFQKLGIGDLDGDGRLDYVIKQPLDNIDPYRGYWQKSPDTYKLEAYNADGTLLWRYDLGYAIERGIWYSPYLVYDLDGDGKAEVAAKTGEGDPRDPDGRVTHGPEYVTILNGATGKEITRADWPSRDGIAGGLTGYNYASRNQMGVAFLDGKTPCLLVNRGTYTLMKLVAYRFRKGKLRELWRWDSDEERGEVRYSGQGAHWMHSGDLDGDGRDEVVLGSNTIDDDGTGLWCTGLGHPDRCFLGDLDPARPGLEVFYHIEPGHTEDGVCLVDAATGEIIWGLKERTYHVGVGMAADIDPDYPGCECWASEDPKGDPKRENYNGNPPRWLFTANGELLARDKDVPPFGVLYWDADSQRELVSGGRVYKYRGAVLTSGIEGSHVFWGDILGDWREELVTTVKGELRIYTTTIPASERRVTLLQDPIYRHDVAHEAMGYTQPPTPGEFIAQIGPAMSLSPGGDTLRFGASAEVTVAVSAPPDQPVEGEVTLTGDERVVVTPARQNLDVPVGGRAQVVFAVVLRDKPSLLSGTRPVYLTAELSGPGRLRGTARLRLQEGPLTEGLIVQAEDFAGQGGGEVHIRDDKPGVMGTCFSHWDDEGHWLAWKFSVPTDGTYHLVLRYCTPLAVQREVQLDDGSPTAQTFAATGGFSGPSDDWAHGVLRTSDGAGMALALKAGEHLLKMTNIDGQGMNLDYVAFVTAGSGGGR